ncbi:hypothetical protein MINTM015_46320 [Mycobacterium paraintracellulare]|nr:hypothetical protein MINTM015_46320 [Mycobacterium paraintracellulare]
MNAGVLQRPPQLVSPWLVGPAQARADQPVVLVGQQAIGSDHGLGERAERVVGEIDDGLVDHVGALGARPQERQAGDGTGDRDPQNDVHPASPSPWPPRTSNVPASLHLRYRRQYQSFGDKVRH